MIAKKRHPSTVARPFTFTIARWCHFGRWSADGRYLLNAAGDIVYPVIQRKKA